VSAAPYGLHVRFTTRAGQGDALASILLDAAHGLDGVDACLLYLVSQAPDEPDTVFVTEVWTDRDAHDASLRDDGSRALIERAMPLLAGPPEATPLLPTGGKGL
jgi:quinol monooxygenase YgiN